MDTFLLAFRRFASRRSLPQIVVSDNATTYQAAADELHRLLHSKLLTEALGREGAQWQFILKRAPWYSGWWDCLIGLMKMSLKKILGRARVSLVVLQTLIVEVEVILNDRPLAHVSSDLEDAKPLIPAQLQAFLQNQFRACWRYEYLTSLREYHRTTGNNNQQVKSGDTVLVYVENPRSTWKLAVVEELMTGKDGLVRAAKIKTVQEEGTAP